MPCSGQTKENVAWALGEGEMWEGTEEEIREDSKPLGEPTVPPWGILRRNGKDGLGKLLGIKWACWT